MPRWCSRAPAPNSPIEPGRAGQRIGYRLRGHAVEIAYWPQLDNGDNVQPAVYPLADGVTAFRVEYLTRAGAWRDNWPLQGEAGPSARRARGADARQRRGDRPMVRPPMKPRARGAALILAMLVAALAATVAIALAAEQQRWFADVGNRRDQVQAQSLALAGVQWARQILQDDARGGSLDHLGEPWAFPLPRTPIANGSIEGGIEDAQGRLNLNNLALDDALGKEERERLARLFAARGIASRALEGIAASLAPVPAADGAQTIGAPPPPPPLPASLRPVRAAEVASMRGVTPRDVALMLPFVTALPAATTLNVNTARPEVLAAAMPGLSADGLAALVADRARKPFTTVADFRARLPRGATLPNETTLALASSYFLVSVRARQGETLAQARALLKRDGRDWPIVVWQTLE